MDIVRQAAPKRASPLTGSGCETPRAPALPCGSGGQLTGQPRVQAPAPVGRTFVSEGAVGGRPAERGARPRAGGQAALPSQGTAPPEDPDPRRASTAPQGTCRLGFYTWPSDCTCPGLRSSPLLERKNCLFFQGTVFILKTKAGGRLHIPSRTLSHTAASGGGPMPAAVTLLC